MMKTKEKIFYFLIGIILVVGISLIMSVRTQCRSREALLLDNRYYEAAEETYKQQVSSVLESYGVCNSGLTMTRVVSLDGEREYRIQIYNRKLQKLDLNTYDNLCNDIDACTVMLPDGAKYPVQVSFGK